MLFCFSKEELVHEIISFRKRRKNWIGTISGTLSHNSPHLFTSGIGLFNEAGWWKLTHNKNPKQYYEYSKFTKACFAILNQSLHLNSTELIKIRISSYFHFIVQRIRREKGAVEEMTLPIESLQEPESQETMSYESSEEATGSHTMEIDTDSCSRTL